MPFRPVLVALVALALPFAGCIVDDGERPAATGTADAPADGAQDVTTAAAPEDAGAPRALATVPISLEGSTGTGACAPAGLGSCRGVPLPLGSSGSGWHRPPLGGRPQSIAVTLAWTASNPATEEMGFAVFVTRSCGDGCTEGEVVESARGASPLSISLPTLTMAEDESLAIAAYIPCKSAGPVFGCFSFDQKYRIEGTAVVAT